MLVGFVDRLQELMNEGRRLNSLARREKNENEKNNLEEDKSDLDELIKALKKDKEALTKNRDDKWELYKYLQDKFTDLAKGEATPIPGSMDVTLKRKQNVPTYRKMDDMGKKLRKITPSSYGRSKKNDPELSGIILNYRTESPNIPLSLYHSVFATFKDNLSSLKAEADDFESLGKLVLDMQEFYNVEEERFAKFTSWLQNILIVLLMHYHLEYIVSEADFIPFNVNHVKYLLLLGKIKNELGDGSGCPYRQGLLGAVFGDKCVVEPPTPLIPLMQLRFDDELLSTAANTFRLLKESLESLKDYYNKRYGADVHRDCAKANIAPKLIAFEKLAGNWFMVVMEYLLSEHFICMYDILQEGDQNTSFLTQKSIEVANELHKMNYVHGDFRTSNFMISKDRKQVMIVDFDWAGKEGSAKYPQFINRFDSLDWHPDVKEGGKIKKAHDIHFITQSIEKKF
ncbi:14128_t:CDS:2 [Funneliformis mosseae]|uniref:14128_t:CDS:1 n=1 Tax=Funneliformis mosseae TaxID=27381 RepID=A0A9N9FAS3_FUNMO|nr:14128_t:CDS:2 [Funneliformis mosseae]